MYKKLLLWVIFLSFIFCGCGKKQEFTDDLDKILKQDKLKVYIIEICIDNFNMIKNIFFLHNWLNSDSKNVN